AGTALSRQPQVLRRALAGHQSRARYAPLRVRRSRLGMVRTGTHVHGGANPPASALAVTASLLTRRRGGRGVFFWGSCGATSVVAPQRTRTRSGDSIRISADLGEVGLAEIRMLSPDLQISNSSPSGRRNSGWKRGSR